MNTVSAFMKSRKGHLLLIVLGALFTLAPLFHTSIWFDESYSVAIARHPFAEIWAIDSHDVHPVFYYFVLHVLYLIFGDNILVYRLFSWVCLVLLGVFGYTHIRKSFGDRIGLLFSFFVFFFPVNVAYAGEIRMYTLVMLLVTVAGYYAWRIHEAEDNAIMPWIVFSLMTILSAYTHYYGLIAAAMMNCILLVEGVVDCVKLKRLSKRLGMWFIFAFVQIGAYMPWLLTLLSQMATVKNSFWITFYFPWTVLEMAQFQVSGNLDGTFFVPSAIVYVFLIFAIGYLLYCAIRRKKKKDGVLLYSGGVYAGVIALAYAASKLMNRMIVYARYLLVSTGLLFLFVAKLLVEGGKKMVNIIFCLALFLMSCIGLLANVRINYAASNDDMVNLVSSMMEKEDAILVTNYDQDANSFIPLSLFPGHTVYYWNVCEWNQESIEAYRAYGEMHVIDSLDEIEGYEGRLWLLYGDGGNEQFNGIVHEVSDQVSESLGREPSILEYIETEYKHIQYTIALYEEA